MEHRASFTVGVVAFVVGITLVACVGEDPAASGPSSSSSGTSGTSSGGGGACSAASPCASGTCVDGYCCDSPCTGLCEACNVKGSEGKCSAVSGKPLHGKCDGDADGVCAGSCDGKTTTACAYPEVECTKGSCAGGQATLPSTCKAGTCPAQTKQACVEGLGCLGDGCLGVKQLATGGYPGHACALMTDGKVRCWGANGLGQLGINPASTAESNRPTDSIAFNGKGVTMLAATGGTTCALLGDKTVQCVGSNSSGQLGQGLPPDATTAHFEPSAVNGVTNATFISGGSGGTFCAIVTGGEIMCWGGNDSGQVGNGEKGNSKPTAASVCAPGETAIPCAKATGAKFVASGDKHTCAIFADDQVACWGRNQAGECGQPPTSPVTPLPFPKLIPPLAGGAKFTATALTAGNALTCAATVSGGAVCWGGNGISGRVGNCDTAGGNFPIPQAVGTSSDCKDLLSGVTAVTTYDISVCAIASGAVKCWGTNEGGQLGDGNSSPSQSYAATTAIPKGAVQVASGGAVNFAVVVDGANRNVFCWGGESESQCGTGEASASHPTPVSPKW